MKVALTPLQTLLLKSVYFERFHKRNAAAQELNYALGALEKSREKLCAAQSSLENVAASIRDVAGDSAAYFEDYFERVWPLRSPEERPIDESTEPIPE